MRTRPTILFQALAACLASASVAAEATNQVVVEFWPPPGVYTNFVGVMVQAGETRVRYTLDGSEPLSTSPSGLDPILLGRSATVRARPYRGPEPQGPTVTQRYEIVSSDIASFRSSLPLVTINTLGKQVPARTRTPAWITMIDATNGQCGLFGRPDYSGPAAVGVRGSSSRLRPKKPYRIELQDEDGADRKVSLLGMPKESDWVLYPAYTDRTLIRDVLAHEVWRQMGHYAVRTRYVELFLVRTNRPAAPILMEDYEGVYVLMETVKRGKDRVSIAKVHPQAETESELEGGYIFKKDRTNPGEPGFKTARGMDFVFVEPKERSITPRQRAWLTNWVNRAEAALFDEAFREPTTGYPAHFDVDSWVDYHWMVELSRNADGYGWSLFLHKDRGGKLKVGPIWDWDLSFGNIVYHGRFRVEKWQWETMDYPLYPWFARMFEDPDFLQRYIDRYHELRSGVFSETNLVALVDGFGRELSEASGRNHQRWPSLSPLIHSNRLVGDHYTDHVDWLRRWIRGRLQWMDRQGFPAPDLRAVAGRDGARVELSGGPGTIYYTTDGSDPRQPGGSISPRASAYRHPVALSVGARLMARVRSPYQLWSPPCLAQGGATNNATN